LKHGSRFFANTSLHETLDNVTDERSEAQKNSEENPISEIPIKRIKTDEIGSELSAS
jgi:hypothetical protein